MKKKLQIIIFILIISNVAKCGITPVVTAASGRGSSKSCPCKCCSGQTCLKDD